MNKEARRTRSPEDVGRGKDGEGPASSEPVVLQELKRDAFGRVELLAAGARRCTRRVACGSGVVASGWVARRLLARERRALERLAGLAGVPELEADLRLARTPSLDGRVPRASDVLIRSWIEGEPLHAVKSLPSDFFERLAELVCALHARGVCHNDLHKEQNVIVGADGWPHLIDFQLASTHAPGSRSLATRAREDLRHVEKHRRRYLRADGGAAAKAAQRATLPSLERSTLARVWRRGGKPLYELVTRRVLGVRDAEPRRSSAGPWPAWTAPRGPRTGGA
jgi:predicted Ser/Thr protein kinase